MNIMLVKHRIAKTLCGGEKKKIIIIIIIIIIRNNLKQYDVKKVYTPI